MSDGLDAEESDAELGRDRRAERRVEVEFPVRFQAPVRTEGRVLELSFGGLRVEVSEDLTHAVRVSLEFDLPEAEAPIGVLADVRWHKRMGPKSDPRWVYGLRFGDLSQPQQAAIRNHLEAVRARREAAE